MSVTPRPEPTDCRKDAAEPACMADANVNPQTGLASDYLNHFSEAVMLLELLTEVPECRDDFFAWNPKNYQEHFADSHFKYGQVALDAYDHADPGLRQRLDTLADSMNEILLATRELMRREYSESNPAEVADVAVRWVKPLIARAGAVINGAEPQPRGQHEPAPQNAVDALLSR